MTDLADSSAVIELRGVTKTYTRGGRAFNAVDCASLPLVPGDFISITGRSGSGKSTLLNMCAGLLRPDGGAVLFEGRDIHSLNDTAISRYRNAEIGYIAQGQSLLSNFTVMDNVCLPWFLFPREGDAEGRAYLLLEKTGVSHLAGAYPKELSGGEMRRVDIARSLINGPRLLIADEPTGDLDAQTTAEIMSLFSAIAREGTAVLMATHESGALNYAAKTYTMSAGNLCPQTNK
jgi:putative ABC transport system ATP-binding protein